MTQLRKYIIIMSGLMLLFYFTGLIDRTPNSILLNLLLDPVSFESTPLALNAVIALEAILASVIVVGFALAGNIELGVMSAFAIYIFNLLWDFMAVFAVVASANIVIAVLLFSPVLFLFVVIVLEWWRGVS